MGTLSTSPSEARLPERARVLVTFALRLTRDPARMSEGDLAPLRGAGLSDCGIHDVASIVAYFSFVNRLAEGLGVALE